MSILLDFRGGTIAAPFPERRFNLETAKCQRRMKSDPLWATNADEHRHVRFEIVMHIELAASLMGIEDADFDHVRFLS